MKVLVLGGTGMLGSMVAKVLPDEWEVLVTARVPAPYPYELVNTWWRRFAVDHTAWQEDLKRLADGCDWIVNCIGATKPLMKEDAAYSVNAHFPRVVDGLGPPVLHPSTDCVFDGSGGRAPYAEQSNFDAVNEYGQSKGDGEEGPLANTIRLRASIIGPECRFPPRHLLGNVVGGFIGAGYADHLWNGITTLAWAKIAMGIMGGELMPACGPVSIPAERWLFHLVPASSVSKDRLVSTILQAFRLKERVVNAVLTGWPVDMRLATSAPEVVDWLWRQGGYDGAPTVEQMVWELAEFCRAEHWPTHDRGFEYWNTGRT